MPMPEIDEKNRKRPLSYDPARRKFILYDEIVSGEESIVPVDSLSEDEIKELVIERWRALPEDIRVQAISGSPYSRDDVIRAIEHDELFGKITVHGESSYLRDLLEQIQRNLDEAAVDVQKLPPEGDAATMEEDIADAVDFEAGPRPEGDEEKAEEDATEAADVEAGPSPKYSTTRE